MSGQSLAERARISMYGLSSIANFESNFLPLLFRRGTAEELARYQQNLQPLLAALNTELEGRDYLVGDAPGRFTVADVMMGSIIGQFGRVIKFDFSPWSNVDAWVKRTTERPAFYPPNGLQVKPPG